MTLDQVNSAIAIGHFRLMWALVIGQSWPNCPFGHNYLFIIGNGTIVVIIVLGTIVVIIGHNCRYYWVQLSLLLGTVS